MNRRAEHWYKQTIETLSASDRVRVAEWLSAHEIAISRDTQPEASIAEPVVDLVAQVARADDSPMPVVPPPTSEPISTELPLPPGLDLLPEGMEAEDPLFALLSDAPETIDPFAAQHLQALVQIEAQRRQMLAEMHELVKKRDQELPAQHVKTTGEYAQLVRLAEDLSSELQRLHQRHGELLRRRSFSQDVSARANIQYQLDSVRPQRARAMQNYERLLAEAKGNRRSLREVEQSRKTAHQQLVNWSQDAKQLVTDAFWSSEPTGSLSADGYDAMGVMFTSWKQQSDTHPATLSLRALARCNHGDLQKAHDDARRAVHLDPSFSFALAVQGYVKCRQGDSIEGIPDITRAIRLDGKQPYGYLLRSLAHRDSGNREAAVADASRVARLAEALPWGHALMARELFAAPSSELRDAAVAVSEAELSCRLSENQSWFCLDTLAAAYAEAGRFGDAVATQRRAMAIVPDRFREDCKRQLGTYRAKRPYRLD